MSPYAVLEISSRATEEEVRKAYRDMAKKWHPDRKLDDQETATKKFKEIDAAYRTILHEYRREARKHPSTASSSSSTSPTSKRTTDLHAERDDNGHHSIHSTTKNTDLEQLDSLYSGKYRAENVDDESRSPSFDQSRSRPSTTDSQGSSNSSSTSTTVSSPLFPSSSSTSSTSSWSSSSSKSSADSTKSSPSKKTSHTSSAGAQEHQKRKVDHVSNSKCSMPPPPPPPSFTFSTTSSEVSVSTYDNPEITLPPATRGSAVIVYENVAEMNETEIEPVPVMAMDTATIAVSSTRPTEEKEMDTWRVGSNSEKSRDKDPSSSKIHSSSKKSPRESSPSSKKKSDHKHEHGHEERTLIPEFDSPLARAVGVLNQWTYTIPLTLTDLFYGKKLCFRVLRCKLSGKRKTVLLDFDIPPGTMHGTQIILKSAGHENADGSRQDIHFIIEEEKHEKFKRVGDDLVLDVRLLWNEGLKRERGVVNVMGLLDGSEREFEVDFVGEGNVVGVEKIEGEGMPVFGVEGRRGCLVVRWEIFMPEPKTKWEALKQVLRL